VKKKPHQARAVGDLVMSALRDLGVPSQRLTRRVHAAWERAVDAAWVEDAVPLSLVGGVLVVGVRSASLRQELTQFHRERLLSVMRAALPDVPLVGLRFTAERPTDPRPGDGSGDR
jgi:hypothetical protein